LTQDQYITTAVANAKQRGQEIGRYEARRDYATGMSRRDDFAGWCATFASDIRGMLETAFERGYWDTFLQPSRPVNPACPMPHDSGS